MDDCYVYWLKDILKNKNVQPSISFSYLQGVWRCLFLHKKQECTMQWYFRVQNKKTGQRAIWGKTTARI